MIDSTRGAISIQSMSGDSVEDDRLKQEILTYLAQHQAEHCIQLSAALADSPHGKTTFLAAQRNDEVVAVGSITGAFHMLLSPGR